MDIPSETKNDKRGRSTVDLVLDNLVYAAEKMAIQLRINMTGDEEKEWARLFEGIVKRNLQSKVQAYVANVFQPEHARRDCVGSKVSPDDYVEVMKRQRLRAKELGMRMDSPVPSSCGSGCAATSSSAVTIDPEGLLYKCPDDAGRPERAFGSILLDTAIRSDNLVPWLSYDWFSHMDCSDCELLPQCAGGCAHKRLFQGHLPREEHCYWALRGDLEARIRDTAMGLLLKEGEAPMEQACSG